MAGSGERHGHLPADVGRKQPPDRAVFAEGMGDYALATLFKAQHSPVAKRSGRLSEANPAGAARGRATQTRSATFLFTHMVKAADASSH